MELIAQGIQGFAEFLDSKNSDNKWTLQGSWLKRLQDKRWRSLFEDGKGKSSYKLVLNSIWGQEAKIDFESQGLKGGFVLTRENWGRENGDGRHVWMGVGKVDVDAKNKVWLIMAQGQNNIYLMPVVRTSGWYGKYGCDDTAWKEKEKKAIEEGKNGVDQVNQWSTKHDGKSIWEKEQDKRLQEKLNKGFSITRKIDSAVYEVEVGKNIGEVDKVEKYAIRIEGGNLGEKIDGVEGFRYLGKNAGILNFGGKECIASEAYFPLDLVILGKTSEKSESKIETTINGSNKEQTINIEDQISQVIEIRID